MNSLSIHPLSPDRWDDLVELFGPERGAQGGCWCIWPFVRGVDFNRMEKAERKEMLKARVEESGKPAPGLLAYDGDEAVGWAAVGPRPSYTRLMLSKAPKPLEGEGQPDPEKIWMLACFFIRKSHRKAGVMRRLAQAAGDFAAENGAQFLEVCPIEPDRPLMWGEGFVGIAPLFRDLGYEEIARRSARRPLMRLAL
ncbi:GNAT family N-acetyltransferase [Stappia sp. GBMRC 2046]|uniref:GNAT family N-acetyltransferase n=1 Tax=Stappia sediminis TaxID=2692190 RepID=A0A7X3S6Q1_9HYPH|nr:GNAT family N-acetyltransferase [Stappia sediminis]MXN64123.1 GNAT family N-acetyltransferase [Stappia sediminis]